MPEVRGVIWCLHGAVGSHRDWEDFSQRAAARGVATRAVDLWRFLECEGLSLKDWAKAFNAEVKADGGEPRHLLGYSMGGRLALHALLDEPSLWQGATIVSAHPGLDSDDEKLRRMASDAEWAALALTAEWPRFLAKWSDQAVLAGGTQAADRSQLANRRRAIARSFMEWSLGKQENLRDELAGLDLPIQWITGETDEKFGDLARDLVPRLSNANHFIVPGAGHRVPWDQPGIFFEHTLAAIDSTR